MHQPPPPAPGSEPRPSPGRAAFRRRRQRPFAFRIPPNAEFLFGLGVLILDALVLNAVVLSVFNFWLPPNDTGIYFDAYYSVRALLFGLYLGFGLLFGRFSVRSFGAVADNFSNSASSLLATFLTFNLLIFASRELARQTHNFPRPVLLFSTLVAIFAGFLLRVALSALFKPYPLLQRAFIVGDREEGRRILRHMHLHSAVRFRLLRVFAPTELELLAAEAIFHRVDEIIVTDPHLSLDRFWAQIFYGRKSEPHAFRVRVPIDPAATGTGHLGLSSIDELPLVTIPSLPLSPLARFAKRVFDIGFAIFALIVTSPVLLLTALAVRLESPGPILYKQRRCGRFGRDFFVIKFRSMVVDAERLSGPKIATDDDPRITRIGRWIRRLGIDELPQFFSVLIGEMSVVGPRPERPFFVEQHLEFQGRRLSMRPGVTGLAAVNARYYLRLTDKVSYDYLYIDHASLWLDLKIIFQTIWVVLFHANRTLNDPGGPDTDGPMSRP